MASPPELLYLLIVGCEVAFWLLLLASLHARYLWRRERLSRALLWSLPVVDVLLVVFTALDLRAGRVASPAHGLAAVYVGFTIMLGPEAVRWADRRFAHRFADGPQPEPRSGWQEVRYDLDLWIRSILAWIIALAVIEGMIAFVADPVVTEPLRGWYRYGLGSVFFWFLFGPVWSFLSIRHRPGGS